MGDDSFGQMGNGTTGGSSLPEPAAMPNGDSVSGSAAGALQPGNHLWRLTARAGRPSGDVPADLPLPGASPAPLLPAEVKLPPGSEAIAMAGGEFFTLVACRPSPAVP